MLLKRGVFFLLSLLMALGGAKGAEFQELGPVAKSAFRGLLRQQNSFLPNSTAPFFSTTFDGACSPTYITNDGYFLLSLHCIVFCLKYGGGNDYVDSGVISTDNIKGIDVKRINLKQAKKVYCPIKGAVREKTSGLRAKVVSIGASGFMYGNQYYQLSRNPELFDELNALGFNGIGGSGDFALMKMEYQPTPEIAIPEYVSPPGECLPIATETSALKTKIWSITHPNLFRSGRSSSYLPLVSAGKIISLNNNLQITSVDADGGSSGGSYFDSQGRIVGIIIATSTSHSRYTYGSTLGIDIGHISAHLKKDLGEELFLKIASGCKLTPLTKALLKEVTTSPEE